MFIIFDICHNLIQVSTWIDEKIQIARDESYRELTNVEGKLKYHQAFEAELAAHKDSLEKVNEVSLYLI